MAEKELANRLRQWLQNANMSEPFMQDVTAAVNALDGRSITTAKQVRASEPRNTEQDAAAQLHRKALNIVSALANTPIEEWATKSQINSALDDFRIPTIAAPSAVD